MSYLDGQRMKLIWLAVMRGDDKASFDFRSDEERDFWDGTVADKEQVAEDNARGKPYTYLDMPVDWND